MTISIDILSTYIDSEDDISETSGTCKGRFQTSLLLTGVEAAAVCCSCDFALYLVNTKGLVRVLKNTAQSSDENA